VEKVVHHCFLFMLQLLNLLLSLLTLRLLVLLLLFKLQLPQLTDTLYTSTVDRVMALTTSATAGGTTGRSMNMQTTCLIIDLTLHLDFGICGHG
jgi:hypothetical protein